MIRCDKMYNFQHVLREQYTSLSLAHNHLQEAIDYAQEQQMGFVTNAEGIAALEAID